MTELGEIWLRRVVRLFSAINLPIGAPTHQHGFIQVVTTADAINLRPPLTKAFAGRVERC